MCCDVGVELEFLTGGEELSVMGVFGVGDGSTWFLKAEDVCVMGRSIGQEGDEVI